MNKANASFHFIAYLTKTNSLKISFCRIVFRKKLYLLFFEIWDNPASIYSVIQTAEKITGEKIEFLFLDEVQVVDKWETFVKSVYDTETFKKLLLYSISNIGSVFSYKSLGTASGTNENTAKRYINILNDSYIISDVFNFAFSLKENVRNSHKLYAADNGIINAVSYRFWDNKAKLFENFVFNELQKQPFDEITFANIGTAAAVKPSHATDIGTAACAPSIKQVRIRT